MTKSGLARALAAEKRLNLTARSATDIIETIFDLIVCNFQNGDLRLEVRGFGVLKVRPRRAFIGRDPRDGRPVQIKAKKFISYKPSAEVNRRLNSY